MPHINNQLLEDKKVYHGGKKEMTNVEIRMSNEKGTADTR